MAEICNVCHFLTLLYLILKCIGYSVNVKLNKKACFISLN